jgi:GABA(A) receptor-associated protein
MEGDMVLPPGEAERLHAKFPGRVPVLVLRHRGAAPDVPRLPKSKFLVPRDLSLGQFIYVVRNQMKLSSEKALFIFVGNCLPTTGTLMSELYAQYKSPDGFLRVVYTSESTFG